MLVLLYTWRCFAPEGPCLRLKWARFPLILFAFGNGFLTLCLRKKLKIKINEVNSRLHFSPYGFFIFYFILKNCRFVLFPKNKANASQKTRASTTL